MISFVLFFTVSAAESPASLNAAPHVCKSAANTSLQLGSSPGAYPSIDERQIFFRLVILADIPRMNTDPEHMVLPFKEFCKTIVAVRLWCPAAGRLMRCRAAKNVAFSVFKAQFSRPVHR